MNFFKSAGYNDIKSWRYGEKEAGQANIFFNRDFKRLYLIKFNIDELGRIPVKVQ